MGRGWRTIEAFWRDCRSRPPADPLSLPLRLLLSSDGTVIRFLNALCLHPTRVEVVAQDEIALADPAAALLEAAPGEKGIARTVWLVNRLGGPQDRRLLFAASVFSLSRISPRLYQAIQFGDRPLGRIIEEAALSTRRDGLEIAHLPHREAARGLGLPEETRFWTRRYRLIIADVVSAAIHEVFSPQLSSYSS